MAKYKIVHEETLKGYFYIEDAESERDAIDQFDAKCSRGEIDFSDLDVIDTNDTAEIVKE